MINFIDMVGLMATVGSVTLLLPSIYQQVKYHNAGVVEKTMLFQIIFVNSMWTIYGAGINDLFVLGRSMVALFFSLVTTYLYFKYRKV